MTKKRINTVFVLITLFSITLFSCAQPPIPDEPPPFDPDMPPGDPDMEPHPFDPDVDPPPGQPQPSQPQPANPQQGQPQPANPQPANPQPGQPQPSQPQPAQPNQPQGQCQTNWHTDIAVTDIFADNQPKGEVFVRVTNHGPCAMHNINDTLDLFIGIENHTNNQYSNDQKETYFIYNIAPGETQTIATGYQIDTGTYRYSILCSISGSAYNDPNLNDNQLKEQIN